MFDQLKRFALHQKLIVFIGLPYAILLACSGICPASSVITADPTPSQQVTSVVRAPAPPLTETSTFGSIPQGLQEAQVVEVIDGLYYPDGSWFMGMVWGYMARLSAADKT